MCLVEVGDLQLDPTLIFDLLLHCSFLNPEDLFWMKMGTRRKKAAVETDFQHLSDTSSSHSGSESTSGSRIQGLSGPEKHSRFTP